MRKYLIIILLLFIFTVYCDAGLFSFLEPKVDVSKKIAQLENVNTELKAGVNDTNLILKDLVKLNAQLRADIKTDLKAQANVNAKAFAGLDKSIHSTMQAGRDVNITNDPQLLKYIIGGLMGVIMFLLRDNFAQRKWLQNMIKSKEEYKQKYEMKINSEGVKV